MYTLGKLYTIVQDDGGGLGPGETHPTWKATYVGHYMGSDLFQMSDGTRRIFNSREGYYIY
jgi:hypothetical protein